MKKLMVVVVLASLFAGCENNDPDYLAQDKWDERSPKFQILMNAGHTSSYDYASGRKYHDPARCMKCVTKKAIQRSR